MAQKEKAQKYIQKTRFKRQKRTEARHFLENAWASISYKSPDYTVLNVHESFAQADAEAKTETKKSLDFVRFDGSEPTMTFPVRLSGKLIRGRPTHCALSTNATSSLMPAQHMLVLYPTQQERDTAVKNDKSLSKVGGVCCVPLNRLPKKR